MKKVTITFEVSDKKTEVRSNGHSTKKNGFVDKCDITGTDVEKDFIKLMKKLREHQLTNKILDALDINKWVAGDTI